MEFQGRNVTIEQCVKLYRFECYEIGRDSPCLVRIYYNEETRKYRSIADIYLQNKKTRERRYFKVDNCDFEEEALQKLLLSFKEFYDENNVECVMALSPDDSEWIGKYLPFWKF